MSDDRKYVKPVGPRRWQHKFAAAFRGLYYGVRGQSSFAVHVLAALVVVLVATLLRCVLWEWCVLLLCIALVLVTELLNSAIEALFHGLDASTKERWNPCLEIAAGAVLVAAGFATLIGGLIFSNRLWLMFGAH